MPRDKDRNNKGPHKRCEGYWREYDAKYRVFNKKTLFDWVVERAEEIGQPFTKRGTRGRKFALIPCQYMALYVIAVFFDMTKRNEEMESRLLTGRHIDHSTFGKIIDRIPEEYLLRLLAKVRSELDIYLTDEQSVYLADSTKISVDRQYETVMFGLEERKFTKTEPITIFVEFFPNRGVLAVNDSVAGQSSNIRALVDFICYPLTPLKENIPLYADRGFDGKQSLEATYDANLSCGIKLKERGRYRGIRSKARRDFDPDGYKAYRGSIEGVFGGITTKGLDRTRFRREDRKRKWNITVTLSQNLQTYMRLFSFPVYLIDNLDCTLRLRRL